MSSKRRVGWLVLAFVVLAALGLTVAAILLASWTELGTASPEGADRAFTAAAAVAGGPPYLEIDRHGEVHLHAELEGDAGVPLATLRVLAWSPEGGRLIRVAFPFWFVRMKMGDHLNLGTLTSALAGDWQHLDLKVSVEEMERRGPGLLLDHRLAGGARILLWTESTADPR